MDVTVDQPGNDEAPRQVDPAGGRGLRRQLVMRPDRDDTLALDQYVLIGTRRAAGAVDDRRAGIERGLGGIGGGCGDRSEEHTSELQSLMRNSYSVVCLKKKT